MTEMPTPAPPPLVSVWTADSKDTHLPLERAAHAVSYMRDTRSRLRWFQFGIAELLILIAMLSVFWWQAAEKPVIGPMYLSNGVAPWTGVQSLRPAHFNELVMRAGITSIIAVSLWLFGVTILRCFARLRWEFARRASFVILAMIALWTGFEIHVVRNRRNAILEMPSPPGWVVGTKENSDARIPWWRWLLGDIAIREISLPSGGEWTESDVNRLRRLFPEPGHIWIQGTDIDSVNPNAEWPA